jgi:PhoH-like ATPase
MPIVDNLRFLFNNDRMMLDEYIKKDIIEIEAMTYIRGRSISDSFLLLDEAQNLTSHELKTVLTRIGENSKIVITGDLGQIDSPYLNETTSGLTNVIEKFKTQELSGHITLTKGERSLVATISSKIL